MGSLLRKASRVDAVIGPACSSACTVTSHLAGGQHLPQLSWGCAASALSNKEQFQMFSRTLAPDTSKGLLPMHEAIMLYAHAATKVLAEGGNLHNGLQEVTG